MAKLPLLTHDEAHAMCYSCAQASWGSRRPSVNYTHETARLLFGTGAHESGEWRYNWQMRYTFQSNGGGHGLWQVQWGSMQDSCYKLRTYPELAENCTAWLFGVGADPKWFDYRTRMQKEALIQLVNASARASCLFARLHYICRTPKPIPAGVQAQAAYYKEHYNTPAGAATEQDFVKAFAHWPGDMAI